MNWSDDDRAEFRKWLTTNADGEPSECQFCAVHPEHPCLFHAATTPQRPVATESVSDSL